MDNITILENKLSALREKWRGKVPKSDVDPNWWKFHCDKCIAVGLIASIDFAKSHKENITAEKPPQDINTFAQNLFGQ